MSKSELHPISHPDSRKRHREEPIETYALGEVEQFNSADPRWEINIVVDSHAVRIVLDENPIFDYHPCRLDKIFIYRSHHKRLILQIGESVQHDNGIWEHEVYSPHGFVGKAYSERSGSFGAYIASKFYKDPKLEELAGAGHVSFDSAVQADFEKQIGVSGLFK